MLALLGRAYGGDDCCGRVGIETCLEQFLLKGGEIATWHVDDESRIVRSETPPIGEALVFIFMSAVGADDNDALTRAAVGERNAERGSGGERGSDAGNDFVGHTG